ncbi:hypothetical protein B0I37DRAFT_441088 [Chaetomium sp. MPI-CAGE-AT-0009]|nr:hypothetical protein B0I37DRAFT_441088 [Chaetomium sp. MPI-CAGE-AT-0009]
MSNTTTTTTAAQSNPQPPHPARRRDPPPLSTTPLTPASLKRLLDTFDAAFSHTHYAVCGRAALAVWGFRPGGLSADTTGDPTDSSGGVMASALPPYVGIVCPVDGKFVILSWARAVGWAVYPPAVEGVDFPGEEGPVEEGGGGGDGGGDGDGDDEGGGGAEGEGSRKAEVIGVPLAGTAEVVGFRLRTVGAATWRRLETARPWRMEEPYVGWVGMMLRTEARVMAVPTLLNEFARAWYFCVSRRHGRGGQQERNIAGLVLWILRRLARDTEVYGERARWKLTVQNVPVVLYWEFWRSFVDAYPEAMGLMGTCGLHPIMEP